MAKPIESLTLAGFGDVTADRAAALAIAEGIALTEIMRTPKADVSATAGKIERNSPLFYGTGDNPLLFDAPQHPHNWQEKVCHAAHAGHRDDGNLCARCGHHYKEHAGY